MPISKALLLASACFYCYYLREESHPSGSSNIYFSKKTFQMIVILEQRALLQKGIPWCSIWRQSNEMPIYKLYLNTNFSLGTFGLICKKRAISRYSSGYSKICIIRTFSNKSQCPRIPPGYSKIGVICVFSNESQCPGISRATGRYV